MNDSAPKGEQNSIEQFALKVESIQQKEYAVAYARVSTDDKGQNPETQLRAIRQWVQGHPGLEILREFQDESTGTNIDRDGFYTMMGFLQNNKQVRYLLIYSADRLARNYDDAQSIIRQLNNMGIKLIYITADSIDVNSLSGRVINSFMAASAEDYSKGLSDKIKAGIERAREEGKHIGRPLQRKDKFNIEMLLRYADEGYSMRDVAAVHNCSRMTIANRLRDEKRVDEFKQRYNDALAHGKFGPAMSRKIPKETRERIREQKEQESDPGVGNE